MKHIIQHLKDSNVYDSISPRGFYTPAINITGNNVFIFLLPYSTYFFYCHVNIKHNFIRELHKAEKYKNDHFGIKMSQKCDHLVICRTAGYYCGPKNDTQLQKECFFLMCKFKLYKSRLNHTGFLKIGKGEKLLFY